tara:strand:+ start:212 stop:1228 length:1017 start_codon:yes stop_codon:yes gene_type:complete
MKFMHDVEKRIQHNATDSAVMHGLYETIHNDWSGDINDYDISPYTDSSEAFHDGDYDEIKKRAKLDGYLYIKGILDVKRNMSLRDDVLRICAEQNLLLKDDILRDDVDVNSGSGPTVFWDNFVKLQSFNEYLHKEPLLLKLFSHMYGEEFVLLPRVLFRFFKNNGEFSKLHQDFWYSGIAQNMWTAWVPMGDTPMDKGVIVTAKDSHLNLGFIPNEDRFYDQSEQITFKLNKDDYKWLTNDFESGDVFLFHNLTTHFSTTNTTNHVRLSADFRFIPLSDPLADYFFIPHMTEQTWDEIYEDWDSTDYQWYWSHLESKFVSADKIDDITNNIMSHTTQF